MKKLLIVSKHQFGYLTDIIKWCYNLKELYDISVVCFDMSYKRVDIPGVKVIYVKKYASTYIRGILFILKVLFQIRINQLVIVEYFNKASLLKQIFPKKKMLLDIRTLSVSDKLETRNKYNIGIANSLNKFDAVSVISYGVARQLGTVHKNMHILPLGADEISSVKKSYDKMNLLYVGTFDGREIKKVIRGFADFCHKYPECEAVFHIVGDGKYETVQMLKDYAYECNVDTIVFHGRVVNTELKPYFDICNIGVSFIPIKPYYNHQPATKTFEYAMSGLINIATATDENVKVINENNGILINDTAEDFTKALEAIHMGLEKFDDEVIRLSVSQYKWKGIVEDNLVPALNSLM